ncbi:hypothetical protein HDE_01817 [Halotydeus destructor]|nr:hypothetical protein HDE_01817 [Halotydeus destructor]
MAAKTASMASMMPTGSSMVEVALQAKMDYEKKLVEYTRSKCLPPSSWELRQKNAQLRFEAVDHFLKHTDPDQTSAVWKLERELATIYEQLVNATKQVRRLSLGSRDRPCVDQVTCTCSDDDGAEASPNADGTAGSP